MSRAESGHAPRRLVRVLTNLRRLDGVQSRHYSIQARYAGERNTIWSYLSLFVQSFHFDAVVFSSETRPLLIFCVLKALCPFNPCRLVGVDYILQMPLSASQRGLACVKGWLLRRVDCFVLHFKDTSVYREFYGIPASRCRFVPFKVNYWEHLEGREFSSDGDYVFTAGRSFRDIPTFLRAMKQAGCPGLLLYEDVDTMQEAGTGFDFADVPPNVRAVKNEGEQSWVDYIAKSKVVVIPLKSVSGYAPGLSLYLMAMAMNKCVVITEGLATRGLLTDEALVVPPGDSAAMADAIVRLWENASIRENVAKRGRAYAMALGGEPRLLSDIAEVCGGQVYGVTAEP